MDLRDELRAIEAALNTIEREGENGAVGIRSIRDERERVERLVAAGMAAPAELDRLDDDLRTRQSRAEDAIRRSYAAAVEAIDDAGRKRRADITKYASSDSVSRRWHDAVRPALERGLSLSDALALFEHDADALYALEANFPSHVAQSGRVSDPAFREEVEAGLRAVEQRLLPHLPNSDRQFREAARRIEGLAVALDGRYEFGLKQAAGIADAGDRMKAAYMLAAAEAVEAGQA